MGIPTLKKNDKLLIWNTLISDNSLANIKSMLNSGEISKNDKLGKFKLSPLHLAAWHNKPEICEFLLSHKFLPRIKKENFSNKTAIHLAAYLGHINVVKAMIGFNNKLTIKKSYDSLGCLPIHYAALSEQKEMLLFLLEVGQSLKTCGSRDGFSAKNLSCAGNVLDLLIHKNNFDLCDLVSSHDGIRIVETNPRAHSDLYIGYRNEYQWGPFHSAAASGNKEIIAMLLKKFPDASCFQKNMKTFLTFSQKK